MRRLGKPAFNRLGYSGLPYGFGSTLSKSYMKKVLRPNPGVGYDPSSLIGFWLQNEAAGGVSFDHSGYGRDGAYTGVTLGQPGIGDGSTAAGYDGINDFNNIYSADLVNDNLTLNPGFETPGAMPPIWLNWVDTLGDGALANEVVIIHTGLDACEITSGLTSNTNTAQVMAVTPGLTYRLRFWTRGDGVNDGRYQVQSAAAPFADIIPTTPTGITAAAYGMIEAEFTPLPGQVAITLRYWCPSVNGGVCYFDATDLRRTNAFLGDRGTIIAPARVTNVGVWTDTIFRTVIEFSSNAGNLIALLKRNAANTFTWQYTADGVASAITNVAMFAVDYMFLGITWDIAAGATGEVIAYLDGVQEGAIQVGLGTWGADLVATHVLIGAERTLPATLWSGDIGPVPVYSEALPPAAMAYLGVL